MEQEALEPEIIIVAEVPNENIHDSSTLGVNAEDAEADSTIHGFNESANITFIEKPIESSPEGELNVNKHTSCEGSDSGVEVIENTETCTLQRTLSTNSTNFHDFDSVTPARSCDSSIISCCSNYEEAYNLLARRNSTLLEDYKLRNSDGTSEGGSESSSVVSSRNSKRNTTGGVKKKLTPNDSKNKTPLASSTRRGKAPVTPRNLNTPIRGKSTDRLPPKTPVGKTASSTKTPSKTRAVPDSLPLNSNKNEAKKTASRGSSSTRTPTGTPSDDGRWPSIHSRPAPLMAKTIRNETPVKPRFTTHLTPEQKNNTLDKYATLPRRRKEKSADSIKDLKKPLSRENSANRASLLKKQLSKESALQKTLPPYPRKKPAPKTRIYHEISVQTALTVEDVEKAFSGLTVYPSQPQDAEKSEKEVQADLKYEELEVLQAQHKKLVDLFENLKSDYEAQKKNLLETEEKLKGETIEKNGLKEELLQNTQRVLAILGDDENVSREEETISSDSLMVLESRFQNVSQVVIKQEDEISKLNEYCRTFQRDLEKSLAAQKTLLQQQQELEAESIELQEFLQAEKTTLSDALKESESEISRCKLVLRQKEKDLDSKQEECKHLVRVNEQRRQESLGLQAKLNVLEGKCRELLVHQGSTVSGAAVALSALISRLDGLVEELVTSYSISDQELDDVIFHNEAYSNSSSSADATPEKAKKIFLDKSPSPKGRGSSFVSAVINAIKNAAAQTSFATQKEVSKDNICTDNSDSIEMLDSETEPCLMMEHVLEDVVVPDGHSHNMISSCHSMISSRLTHSESLNNLSQAIYHRQLSEQASFTESLNASFTSDVSSTSELGLSISVVDQVIEVDNLVTRLLKVIRIIQLENDDCMNELQEERDGLSQQVEKQKDTNKIVGKQLKDWEVLGARLKSEVRELMQKLSKKNDEINEMKCDVNQQRREVEKLNQDVCDLSTALSKSELEFRMKEDEVATALRIWEDSGETPEKEVVARIIAAQNEVPILKEKLVQRDKQLSELTQEFLASRQVLSESWKEAVSEAKKQYEAIDSALETLHSIQAVVQQCPPLAKLQRELEEMNFQSASGLPLVVPPDCNANAALLQAIANLELASPINTTA